VSKGVCPRERIQGSVSKGVCPRECAQGSVPKGVWAGGTSIATWISRRACDRCSVSMCVLKSASAQRSL